MNAEAISFDNCRGQRLAGHLHGDPAPTAVVVCHGMLSNQNSAKHVSLAERLAARGLAALRFDFAGRGESQGQLYDLCYSDQREDLQAALDWLRDRGTTRIGMVGSSMGGAVVLLVAPEVPELRALATLAAVAHPGAVAARHPEAHASWLRRGFLETEAGRIGRHYLDDAARHALLPALGALDVPLLVQHGDADVVVPVQDARDIAAAAPRAQLVEIPGGDHRFEDPAQQEAALNRIVAFMVAELVA